MDKNLLEKAFRTFAGTYGLGKLASLGTDYLLPGGERVDTTLLVVRPANLKKTLERIGGESVDVFKYLNTFFASAIDLVDSNGGVAYSLDGTALVTVFPKDSSAKGLYEKLKLIYSRCSEEMVKYSEENIPGENVGGVDFFVNDGFVLLLSMGSMNRLFNVVLGNNISTIFRTLEVIEGTGGIYLTESARQSLCPDAALERVRSLEYTTSSLERVTTTIFRDPDTI